MAKIPEDKFGRTFEERVIESFGGITVKDIAEKLNQPYHTFRNWLKQSRDMPYEVLLEIAKMNQCSLHWLLTGEGEMFAEKSAPKSNVIPLPHRVEFSEVEWALITEAAEVAGKSPDEWVKDTLNDVYGTGQEGHLIQRTRTVFDALDELVGEMVDRRLKRG